MSSVHTRRRSIGRAREHLMKAAALGLGLFLATAWFGCGRMPPEALWEPTAEDSAAIDVVVQANRELFMSSFNEAMMSALDTTLALPESAGEILETELATNPYKQRFRCDSMQHLFFTDSFDLQYTLVAGLDTAKQETTATVTTAETIPGILRFHAYSFTRYLHDTMFFPAPGETLILAFYDTVFTDTSMIVEKSLSGNSVGGCVLKKENGEWGLWKYAGGNRFYAPSLEDAPYIAYIYIAGPDTTYDIRLRPDTTESGIQRFYTPDELPTFSVGDTISVSGVATYDLNSPHYSYFNRERHEFISTDAIALDSPGVYRLSFEEIPATVLYEIKGEYEALVWGAVIRVLE